VTVPVPVLTIDGPSGSGKGTIARQVAKALGWNLLDSGALYRLVGLAAERQGLTGAGNSAIAAVASGMDVRFRTGPDGSEQILLDGQDVTRELRTEDCGRLASAVALLPAVRDALHGAQQAFRRPPGLVADGRDMGTQVFPDAGLKVYLTASASERAKRRHKQLKDKGIDVRSARWSAAKIRRRAPRQTPRRPPTPPSSAPSPAPGTPPCGARSRSLTSASSRPVWWRCSTR
jgi:cytidylate kinase